MRTDQPTPVGMDDLCQEAERFAELFYGVEQLALILDISADEIRVAIDTRSPLGKAVLRGWLLSESEFRASVIKHAKQGSTAAQAIVQDLLATMSR